MSLARAHKTNRVMAVIKAIFILIFVILLITPAALMLAIGWDSARKSLFLLCSRIVKRIMNITIDIKGQLSSARPVMLVCNHASYIDVLLLSSVASMSFTPKREVESWPGVGWLCKAADCVFVERTPAAMKKAQAEMQDRLKDDKILVIFPEGTTNDGNAVKGFKSGFFELAAQTNPPLPVQPVTITYTHSNRQALPKEQGAREHIAWVGDADFFTHFLSFLGLRSITATLTFGEPKNISDFESRKELCKACEDEIGGVLQAELAKIS